MKLFCWFTLFLGCLWADTFKDLDSFYLALQEKGKTLMTFQAKLTQTKTLKLLSKELRSQGKVLFKKEEQVRWEIEEPETSIIWIREKTMWCYFPEFKQCEKYSLEKRLPNQTNPSALFLGIFQDLKAFQKEYTLEYQVLEKTYQLTILPKTKNHPLRKVQFEFDQNELTPQQILFTYRNGDQMKTQFKEIQVNQPLEDKRFIPELPPDTEIIEMDPK